MNADTLQDVLELIFALLQDMAHAGISIDCADRKVQTCFTILSVLIADHMENVSLHELKTNAYPKYKIPIYGWEINARSYRVWD